MEVELTAMEEVKQTCIKTSMEGKSQIHNVGDRPIRVSLFTPGCG